MKNYICISLVLVILLICLTACVDLSNKDATNLSVDNYIDSQTEQTTILETTSVEITATEKVSESNNKMYAIDYEDATSFETALNNGEKVEGKIVQFEVNDYQPSSALGINCWAGEHLNFISDVEIDVKKGDIVIGRCIKDASKVMFYSWKIPFEVIEVKEQELKSETSSDIPTTVVNKNQTKVSSSAYSLKNDDVKEVVKLLEEDGFTNIKTEAIYDLDHTSIWSRSSLNWVETVSIAGENSFSEGDIFEKKAIVNITYHAFEKDNPDTVYNKYTVSQLFKDLESNPMRAEDAHLYEFVEIKGRVSEISPNGNYILICDNSDYFDFDFIYCGTEADEFNDYIYNLSTGDTVNIRGKITQVNVVYDYKIDVYSFQ